MRKRPLRWLFLAWGIACAVVLLVGVAAWVNVAPAHALPGNTCNPAVGHGLPGCHVDDTTTTTAPPQTTTTTAPPQTTTTTAPPQTTTTTARRKPLPPRRRRKPLPPRRRRKPPRQRHHRRRPPRLRRSSPLLRSPLAATLLTTVTTEQRWNTTTTSPTGLTTAGPTSTRTRAKGMARTRAKGMATDGGGNSRMASDTCIIDILLMASPA